jgi:hypothetical protein
VVTSLVFFFFACNSYPKTLISLILVQGEVMVLYLDFLSILIQRYTALLRVREKKNLV